MSDEELDELILSRLRKRRVQADVAEIGEPSQSASDMAAFFNEPESRIQDRLRDLAADGRIVESAAAPDRWMIVLTSRGGTDS